MSTSKISYTGYNVISKRKSFLLLLICLFSSLSFSQPNNYSLGSTVSDFTVTDVSGVTHNLYDYTSAGRMVMLEFYFPNQIVEASGLYVGGFYDKYGCNEGDVVVITINTGNNDAFVAQYTIDHWGPNPGPAVSGTNGGGDALTSDFGIIGFPTFCVIGSDNKLKVYQISPINNIGTFESAFANAGLSITPMPCAGPPSADFSANNVVVQLGQTVNFTDLSAGSVNTWNWSFPGSNVGSSSLQNPSNVGYSNVGCYDVELTVSGASGTSDTESKSCYIDVVCPPFAASFGYFVTGLSVAFTNVSVGAETYFWDFGDGNTSVDSDPVWNYSVAGTYTITLVATDSDCSGTASTESYDITVGMGQNGGNVSLVEQAEDVIIVSPNPTKGLIVIENVTQGDAYTVLNTQGKVLLTGIFKSDEMNLDLSNYPSGIYYLKINNSLKKISKVR